MKLLLVDACRNDPQEGRNIDLDTRAPAGARASAALFSCKCGERAFETPKLGKGHGVFFYHVLQGLKGKAKNRKGEVTWSGLADYVTEKVSDERAGAHRRRRQADAAGDQEPHRQVARPGACRAGTVLPRPVGGVLRRLGNDPGRHEAPAALYCAIGNSYDKNDPKKAYPVNGVVKGNRIDFYPNPGQPGGRHFTYYLSEGDPDLMAGSHRDADGRVWGGFACRLKSPAAFPNQRPVDPAGPPPRGRGAEAGRQAGEGGCPGVLPGRVAAALRQDADEHCPDPARRQRGSGREAGAVRRSKGNNAIALVDKRNPSKIELTVQPPLAGQAAYHFHGQLQSHDHGVSAGTGTGAGGARTTFGSVLVRER